MALSRCSLTAFSFLPTPHLGLRCDARSSSTGVGFSKASCSCGVQRPRTTAGSSVIASTSEAKQNAGGVVLVEEFFEQAQGFGEVHFFIKSYGGRYTAKHPVSRFRYNDSVQQRPGKASITYKDEEGEVTMVINQVASASFKEDKVLGVPIYIVQFLDKWGLIAFSFTLKGDPKTNQYLPMQVETYKALLNKYGRDLKFSNELR